MRSSRELGLSSEAAQAGGALPLDAVFRQFVAYVGAIGLRMLGRRDEVDDLVQDVFLAATRGLRQISDPGAVKAWLITVTLRLVRRRLRWRRLQARLGLDGAADYEEVADPSAPPDMKALLARVYRALDELPANQRIAWTLRYVQGERLETIAHMTDCSLATVKRRIAAASDMLRKTLVDGRAER
ncbi:MAG: RNA polymerase sigma factor [Deltaproteobacteria bacterium]|nr:RNA polymerase sigma factor [Deltaproteobacteria bacterium]